MAQGVLCKTRSIVLLIAASVSGNIQRSVLFAEVVIRPLELDVNRDDGNDRTQETLPREQARHHDARRRPLSARRSEACRVESLPACFGMARVLSDGKARCTALCGYWQTVIEIPIKMRAQGPILPAD